MLGIQSLLSSTELGAAQNVFPIHLVYDRRVLYDWHFWSSRVQHQPIFAPKYQSGHTVEEQVSTCHASNSFKAYSICSQSEPSSNGSSPIPYKVDGTPITLLITPLLGQKISREDLIIALYDSREYIRRHIRQQGNGRLSGKDEPFSSTKLPSPPDVNCVVAVKSGKKLKSMTYKYLGDTVQGLMDYTFFPYTAATSSLTFEVSHDVWGVLGTGSLSAFQPQAVKASTAK